MLAQAEHMVIPVRELPTRKSPCRVKVAEGKKSGERARRQRGTNTDQILTGFSGVAGEETQSS